MPMPARIAYFRAMMLLATKTGLRGGRPSRPAVSSQWMADRCAAGVPLSYPVMLAAAAPIFIMGAMPLGWGGFGARELSAVVVLGALGIAPEQATVTGLLYGISAVLQGVLAAPLFVLGERAET